MNSTTPFDDAGEAYLAIGNRVGPSNLESSPSFLYAPSIVFGGVTPKIPFIFLKPLRDDPRE